MTYKVIWNNIIYTNAWAKTNRVVIHGVIHRRIIWNFWLRDERA